VTSYEHPTSHCRFAIAVGDITPPVGMYHRMWGAATHERSEGIHRPLRATVAILERAHGPADTTTATSSQGAGRLVLVSLDHCLFGVPEITQLLDDVSRQAAWPRDELSVIFTHTHGAGLMSLDRQHLPGGELIPQYLRDVATKVAQLLREAATTVSPATLTYAVGHCDLAAQRDFWDADRQQFVCGFNPAMPADDTVLALRVTGSDGTLRATIVNYACHPTTLAWDNRLVSPDFPGAMRETIEAATGVPCLFVQGASGELGPREGFVGDVAVADRNGRQLGYAALAALEGLGPPNTCYSYAGPQVSGATIGVWRHEPLGESRVTQTSQWRQLRWDLPLDWRPDLPVAEQVIAERSRWSDDEAQARSTGNDDRARECRAMVERQDRLLARLAQLPRGTHYPLEIRLARLGDALWLAVPGEHYSWLQRGLRQQFPGRPIVVATLLNGWGPSYIPTADTYGRNIYQETIAVVAAGSLEKIVTEVARVARELLTPDH